MAKNHNSSRLVLITGGTGSVGRELVKAFVGNGDKVVFQYLANEDRAHKLEKAFGADAIQIDFSKAFELPNREFDVIINNAGVNISNTILHDIPLEAWNETLTINLTVPFRICKSYLPAMVKNGWGRIINISSIYGLRGTDWNTPYNTSKHGLSGLTKSIAKDYASFGITSNEICPGPVDSEMMQKIGESEARDKGVSTAEYLQEYTQQIPAQRLAKPEEIASLSLYIASTEAAYLNGASIPLDGAWIA